MNFGATPDFMEHLARCMDAANAALGNCSASRDRLLKHLSGLAQHTTGRVRATPTKGSPETQAALSRFREQLGALERVLGQLIERSKDDLSSTYSALEQDSRFVTVMLFGRTRAGKSTTMEALMGGDGATIGIGRQHTTRTVNAYYLPPEAGLKDSKKPGLRIVDTPGIEGFEGDALGAMAEEFIERADHVFFLLTEDKASASELERFSQIRTQGKGVTVLLNVKRSDEDLDLLASSPELIFQPEQLEGHQRRIAGYLERNLGLEAPEVIPFHARAGWIARRPEVLLDAQVDRAQLFRASRLQAVERRLAAFIEQESLPARIRAPHDVLRSHIVTLKDELRPFAGRFRAFGEELAELDRRTARALHRAEGKAKRRITDLRSRYQAASDEIPGLVDELIASSGGGRGLKSRWQAVLDEHRVPESGKDFIEGARADCEAELQEEARVTAFDGTRIAIDDVAAQVDDYRASEETNAKQKYLRAGARAGGGALAGGLAAWAVTNWWNPSGWAAAGAALLVGAAGYAGQRLTQVATDEWAATSKRELYGKRSAIIDSLRKKLWANHQSMSHRCTEWLSELLRTYRDASTRTLRSAQNDAKALWHATVEALDGLDEVAADADGLLIERLTAMVIPEVREGHLRVTGVHREPGLFLKLRVQSRSYRAINVLGACIGKGGTRVKQLRALLGGEHVAFIDESAPLQQRVIQALNPATISAGNVVVAERSGEHVVKIVAAGQELYRVLGPRGVNLRLAEEATGTRISLPRRAACRSNMRGCTPS